MQEYMEAGVKLGWLIDRKTSPSETLRERRVEIYRQGKEIEILDSPATLSEENILPGFILDMEFIWQ